MSSANFDTSVEAFDNHYDEMRGYIRRQVTRQNLNHTLHLSESEPLRVLDMEGGVGYDADWLAAMGHQVVLMDSSAKQLERAYDRSNLAKASIIEGDIDMALKLYGPTGFDLVLSHGVLLYQENAKEYVAKLGRLVRPLGALSLLTAGQYGKIRRFQKQGDQQALDKLTLTGRYDNNIGLPATAHLPHQIEEMLESAGFDRWNWFGVRIESDEDRRKVEDVPVLHRHIALQKEIMLSRDRSRRPDAQLLHFIAGKNT
jgi:SAM-dependent methyltransferase